MWNTLKTSNIFTIETSFFGYNFNNKSENIINFHPNNLCDYGADIAKAIYAYSSKDKKEFALA